MCALQIFIIIIIIVYQMYMYAFPILVFMYQYCTYTNLDKTEMNSVVVLGILIIATV